MDNIKPWKTVCALKNNWHNMEKYYHKLAKVCLGLVLLIIVAGSVVRMTGSGMGCPDWPKCFGYLIPPTSEDVINFKPNHEYKKGQVIQIDAVFYYAKSDFTSTETLHINNWKKNTTHSYNTFNVVHTWIEFINRVITAIAGIPVVLLFVLSILLFKKKKLLLVNAGLVLFLMGFAAWLGKTVVDSNLMPTKISMHLAIAYLLVLVLTFAIFKSKIWQPIAPQTSAIFKKMLIITFIFTIIQIILGIQVRQFVDGQMGVVGYQKELWLQNPELNFYIHRSFSIVLLIVNFWLFYTNKKYVYKIPLINAMIIFLCFEVLIGIVMSYLDFPFISQPLHLVFSAMILALQCFIMLRVFTKTRNFAS